MGRNGAVAQKGNDLEATAVKHGAGFTILFMPDFTAIIAGFYKA